MDWERSRCRWLGLRVVGGRLWKGGLWRVGGGGWRMLGGWGCVGKVGWLLGGERVDKCLGMCLGMEGGR